MGIDSRSIGEKGSLFAAANSLYAWDTSKRVKLLADGEMSAAADVFGVLGIPSAAGICPDGGPIPAGDHGSIASRGESTVTVGTAGAENGRGPVDRRNEAFRHFFVRGPVRRRDRPVVQDTFVGAITACKSAYRHVMGVFSRAIRN